MVGDLVIREGGLEVLRNRTRDVVGRLQSVPVATAGDYISSGVGGSELAGPGCSAGETIDDTVMAVSRDLGGFSQSVNGSINTYNAIESDAAVTFQQTARGGPAVMMDNLRRKMEEQ